MSKLKLFADETGHYDNPDTEYVGVAGRQVVKNRHFTHRLGSECKRLVSSASLSKKLYLTLKPSHQRPTYLSMSASEFLRDLPFLRYELFLPTDRTIGKACGDPIQVFRMLC